MSGTGKAKRSFFGNMELMTATAMLSGFAAAYWFGAMIMKKIYRQNRC